MVPIDKGGHVPSMHEAPTSMFDDSFKGAVKWNICTASKWSAMLQNHDRFWPFSISEHFPARNGSFIATGSRKTSAMKRQQLIPV